MTFEDLQQNNEFLGTEYVADDDAFIIEFAHQGEWDIGIVLHHNGTYSVEISHF